jgi:hypothetical protein
MSDSDDSSSDHDSSTDSDVEEAEEEEEMSRRQRWVEQKTSTRVMACRGGISHGSVHMRVENLMNIATSREQEAALQSYATDRSLCNPRWRGPADKAEHTKSFIFQPTSSGPGQLVAMAQGADKSLARLLPCQQRLVFAAAELQSGSSAYALSADLMEMVAGWVRSQGILCAPHIA